MQNLKLLALTVALLAGVSNAFAQSAEETVAFMTDGMEDGREGVSQSKQYLVTQEPGQPKFTITTTPASAPVTVSVQRIDECKFSVEYVGEPEMEGEYILDFAQFVGASRIGGEASLQFSGSCPLKFRGECVKDHMVPTGFAVEPLRLVWRGDTVWQEYLAHSGQPGLNRLQQDTGPSIFHGLSASS